MGAGSPQHPSHHNEGAERRRRRRETAAGFAAAEAATTAEERRAALDGVVTCNMPLARSLAGQHRGKGIPLEDLEQVAYTALVRAVRRFRLSHEVDFLAYAVPTIRGELKRHFRDHGWMVRPPRRVTEIQGRVVERRDQLTEIFGHAPTDQQLAADLGEALDDVRTSLVAQGCFAPTSLDQPVSMVDGDTPRADLLVAPEPDPYLAAEARVMLRPAVSQLAERDREILRMRFYEGLTQAEIGSRIGVTQTQVSRTLRRILEDLHQTLAPELAELAVAEQA